MKSLAKLGLVLLLGCSSSQSTPVPPHTQILPKALVGLQPDYGGALVVDKSRALMEFYDFSQGEVKKIKSMKIASGKHHGNKLVQGDNRTPEGIYYFSMFREQKTLLPKYGTGAFVTNYPNIFDRMNRKTGGGIWLHGTNQEYRVDEKYDSEGCVVLENEDLNAIGKYIKINRTPIIIYNELPLVTVDEQRKLRDEITSFLRTWSGSWEGKQLDKYMNHYSKSRFRSRGHGWDSWRSYKKSLNNVYVKIGVKVSDPRVFHFHPYAYVDFVQTYSSKNINDTGDKRLALFYEKGQWKIVSETFFKKPKSSRDISGTNPTDQNPQGVQAKTL